MEFFFLRAMLSWSFWAVIILALIIFVNPSRADTIALEGHLVQGGLLRGQVRAGSKILFDGRQVRVSSGGWFVFGFDRNQRKKGILQISFPDGSVKKRELKIQERIWTTQRIDGLQNEMVTPSKESLERIRRDAKEVAIARSSDTDEVWFRESFIWPVLGKITGIYGTRRVLNGLLRQPHYGIDISAPKGTPVVAPASGRVALAALDHYYSGGIIILDHGHGVSSTLLHLQSLNVVIGQKVLQGKVIGSVGAGGRATGPHLDWRMNWFTNRIDPLLLVKPMM